MPNKCVVPGCPNHAHKAECKGLHFYTLPHDHPDLLRKWFIAMHLSPNSVNKHSRMCSVHFIGGRRQGKDDVPQLFSGNNMRKSPKARQPLPVRARKTYITLSERRDIVHHDHCYTQFNFTATCLQQKPVGSSFLSEVGPEVKLSSDASVNTLYHIDPARDRQSVMVTSTSSQTHHSNNCSPFSIEQIAEDKGLVRFYTGFEDYNTLMICYKFLGPCVHHLHYWSKRNGEREIQETRGAPRMLSPLNEFFLVLCRIRLGLLEQDLAFRFGISQPTVSRICITWLNTMYYKFKEVSIWPTREQVNATMPASFSEYPTTRIVIDATEIFIEQPSSPVAQQQTFSSYKNHNTLKVLIGITPSGAISFVSKLYGGSISDRELTIQSGLLEHLEPGDSVMADKGFTIADLLSARGVSLNIPPMKTQEQLTEQELLETRRIASVRIHVERAIRRVKAFKILEVVPNCMAGIIDQLFFVCSFLTNFHKPLV